GVAERDRGERCLGVDLEDGDVGLRVATDELRLHLVPGVQLHQDLVRVLYHVVVGQDETGGVEDEARPQAPLRQSPPGRRSVEEALEGTEVMRVFPAAPGRLGHSGRARIPEALSTA